MGRYFYATLSARDEHVSTTDRLTARADSRIVNLEIGPVTIMLSGRTEEETERTILGLHDALTTLLAASRARRVAEIGLHPSATLVSGDIPAHVPGAYPTLSCCGGDAVQLVERPAVEHITRTPQS